MLFINHSLFIKFPQIMISKFIFKMPQFNSNKRIIFYSFLLVYASLLIYLCNKLVIWDDESYSLSTTANPLSKVLKLSYFFEGQPPVYFLLLSLWRKINDGIFFARLLSIIFTFLSAFFLNKVSKLIFKQFDNYWIIVLFLLNPFTVWASLEIRLYSLLILESFVTIYLFYLIYFFDKPKLKFLFVFIASLGVYTQYYFVFLIISLSILLLSKKGWRTFLNFCLWSMMIAFIFSPNLLFIRNQYIMHQFPLLKLNWYSQLSYILFAPVEFLLSINALHVGKSGHLFAFFIFGSLILLLFFKLWNQYKKHKYQDIKTIFELTLPIIILLTIFIIVFLASNLFYLLQYLTIIFPFYCLLYSAIGIYSQKIKTVIYGVLGIYYVGILIMIYHPPYLKRYDEKSVANFIHTIEYTKEPILFKDKTLLLSLKPYYKGNNALIPIPEKTFDYNFYKNEIKDTAELGNLIKKGTCKNRTFLWINWDDDYATKRELTNAMIDAYFRDNYMALKDTIFAGKSKNDILRVRRFVKKQDYRNIHF